MSDLVKSGASNGMAKRGSGRKKTVNVGPPKVPPTPELPAEGGMVEAAVLLADSEYMTAMQAYDSRDAENFQRLLTHVKASGRSKYNAVKAAVQDTYGLSERDIYSEGSIESEDDWNNTALLGE